MKKLHFALICVVFALIGSGEAKASGFQLNEASVTNMSRSFAGVGVGGDDYSASFYNPAGISLIKQRGIQSSATLVRVKSEFTGDSIFTGPLAGLSANGGKSEVKISSVVPAAFFVTPINDRLNVGISLGVPFGLGTSYAKDSFTRFYAVDSNLKMMEIAATASYKINSRLALGLSAGIQRGSAKLSSVKPGVALDVAELDGKDYRLTLNLGALYSFNDNHRVGFAFRPSVHHEMKGSTNSNVNIFAELRTPELFTLSSYHKLTEKFALLSTVRRTNWSRFDNLDILADPSGAIISKVHENWKDSWAFALGADYALSKEWTLRTGVAYDQTPIDDEEYRTARIPDASRVMLSLGASFSPNPKWQIDAGFTAMRIEDSAISSEHAIYNAGTPIGSQKLNGKFSGKGLDSLLGLGVQYKF